MSSDFQNRLRKNLDRPAPAEHPAPDVLNAYIEKVLTPAEERQITEHLAACGECREVVFLATEAVEEPAQLVAAAAAPAAPIKGLSRMRWWAWALPIAAVIVVVILISEPSLLRSRKAAVQMAEIHRDEAQLSSSTAAEQKTEEPAASMASDKTKSLSTFSPNTKQTAPARTVDGLVAMPAAPPPVPQVDRRELAKEKDSNQLARNEAAAGKLEAGRVAEEPKSAAAMSAPSAAQPGDQLQSLKQSQGAAANLTTDGVARDDQYAYTTESTNGAVSANRANRSKAANLDAKAGQLMGGFSNKLSAKKTDSAANWRATAAGGLEHFLLGKWEPALGDSGSYFLAVTTFGENVWAGGKNLALYHSPDNGVTWERQTLRVRIAADINQILFTSATDGVLTTNLGTSFETHDGGKSWSQGKM